MKIDDSMRLDYILKLLNCGGTNGLIKIAPEVCGDWNRELIDFSLSQDLKSVRADLRLKLKELGEQRDATDREMQKVCKQIEELN